MVMKHSNWKSKHAAGKGKDINMYRNKPSAAPAGTAELPRTHYPYTRLSFTPAQTAPRGDTLVVVFLRDAADGLNMVVPHAEYEYHRLRPSLHVPGPDEIQTP